MKEHPDIVEFCHSPAYVRTRTAEPPINKNVPEPFFIKNRVRTTLVDIPTGLGTAHLAEMALRVAFADFSTAPWRGFEKSERGPNNSSLFLPQAAVVVVALG